MQRMGDPDFTEFVWTQQFRQWQFGTEIDDKQKEEPK